jgi:lipopolysaccharide heptosyltransferase II
MNTSWQNCKNILCIRPDNMGDLLMSVPAIRALKQTFNARINILTSSMAAGVAKHIAEIDDILIFDVPWVKSQFENTGDSLNQIVETIKNYQFDAAVIFTVYSQNPLPTVMLAYLAGIPLRLAYCRENPYGLLTHWLPDSEPYSVIKHQVRRDLDLVAYVGATTTDNKLRITLPQINADELKVKLKVNGVNPNKNWLVLHAGVSELKREYPIERWIDTARLLIEEMGYQVIFTGGKNERDLTDKLALATGYGSISAGGLFSLDEFINIIAKATLVITVNTGTLHIAAALGVPVVVLYALTNPQHTPWKVPCKVLPYQIQADLQSQNEVIKHVNKFMYHQPIDMPAAADIIEAVKDLLQ